MGHFGRRPIKLAWFGFVFPALYLNYLGQGALILDDPSAVKNPFYLLVPDPLLYPMVGLSTLATIIASQAVISGAFSLTKQAVQLGYSPRVHVIHTSEKEVGQIYVPNVNWMLLGAVIALVLGFRSSSALASAYGIAVTLTMMIDTVLAFVVVRALWKWGGVPPWPLSPCSLPWISPSLPRIRSRSLMGAGFRWSWVCSSTPC
jgi:KUP system potassium uptake protein